MAKKTKKKTTKKKFDVSIFEDRASEIYNKIAEEISRKDRKPDPVVIYQEIFMNLVKTYAEGKEGTLG